MFDFFQLSGNMIQFLIRIASGFTIAESHIFNILIVVSSHPCALHATCATTLCLTSDIHETGKVVIANPWFGCVKTAIALKECGLYSVMLVNTAHRRSPRESLDSHDLAVGDWVAYTANLDGVA